CRSRPHPLLRTRLERRLPGRTTPDREGRPRRAYRQTPNRASNSYRVPFGRLHMVLQKVRSQPHPQLVRVTHLLHRWEDGLRERSVRLAPACGNLWSSAESDILAVADPIPAAACSGPNLCVALTVAGSNRADGRLRRYRSNARYSRCCGNEAI